MQNWMLSDAFEVDEQVRESVCGEAAQPSGQGIGLATNQKVVGLIPGVATVVLLFP